jgi:hypothetical protein
MHDKHHTTEERNEGKLSRSVLETSGTGDSLAEFNRSCHDAIGAIFNSIKSKSKFVLDADISKCFDRINHNKLLSKLNTFPTLRRQIRAWLKAGVMDGKKLFPTTEGTPQGGVLSPLLANIALHGLKENVPTVITTSKMEIRLRLTTSSPNLVVERINMITGNYFIGIVTIQKLSMMAVLAQNLTAIVLSLSHQSSKNLGSGKTICW